MSLQAQGAYPPIEKIVIIYIMENTYAGELIANLQDTAMIAVVISYVIYKFRSAIP